MIVAVIVAALIRRRRPDPPPRDAHEIPRQVDRADFPRPDAPWLVALFTSRTCESCAAMLEKVVVLESGDVATCDVDYQSRPDLHARYKVSGVPMVVLVDADGVVRAGFVGPATATDLWAALAEVRRRGASSEPGLGALP